MQSTSWEMLGWMKHKLESRLQGEISITSDMQRTPPSCQCRRLRFDPWVKKIPWRMEWLPTPVFLLGELNEQRSLVGYSPWGLKESDMTEGLTLEFFPLWQLALRFSLEKPLPQCANHLELQMAWLHPSSKIYYFSSLKTKIGSIEPFTQTSINQDLVSSWPQWLSIRVNHKTSLKWLYKVTHSLSLTMKQVYMLPWLLLPAILRTWWEPEREWGEARMQKRA